MEDVESVKLHSMVHTACEKRNNFLNPRRGEMSDKHPKDNNTFGTHDADICETIKTTRESGATNVTTRLDLRNPDKEKAERHRASGVAEVAIVKILSFAVRENLKHNAASSDHGKKENTACESAKCGRNAVAALSGIKVDDASKSNLDGTTSLNGFGDLSDNVDRTNESKKSTGKKFTPGTRSGY